MTTKNDAIAAKKVITPEFMVSFPAIFKPKAYKERPDDLMYSIVMVFTKDTDLSGMKKAANNAGIEKWGPDKSKWPKNFRSPFRDGAEKETEGYGPNTIYVSAKSKTQVGLVNEDLQPILSETEFYAGCIARAQVIAYAYSHMGNNGVGFSLQNIQKCRDGKHLSGRQKAEDVFDRIDNGSNDPASYGSFNTSDSDSEFDFGI